MATEVQIDQMTLAEKLELVDELWLSMTSELESLAVSQEEKELLDGRWDDFLSNPDAALTVEQFQQKIKAIRG